MNEHQIRLDGQVALVTGSGRGLGREYAMALASRGARVVVNGTGQAGDGAEQSVVDEITSAGGEAIAMIGSVTDRPWIDAMTRSVEERWGSIDILVANAGFVRDKTFAKIDLDDFLDVLEVHVIGAINCLKAIWPGMIERRYGRVILIGSSTGLVGNFGQSSYGTAKMAMVGLMNTLGLEGEAKNVRVNCFAPAGASRMNVEFLGGPERQLFHASRLNPGILFLAGENAPNRAVLMGGGGSFERAYTMFTRGIFLETGKPEELAARWAEVSDLDGAVIPAGVQTQIENELANITRRREGENRL
jgi:NAD(P)-dependent dehydrogenase (short-subunit alcohol dehydrogenase family)